jgi:hypothetical protein
MILEKGDMWSALTDSDLWLFTANSYIRKDGQLVMGRGLALDVKKRYPYLPKPLGDMIKRTAQRRLLTRNPLYGGHMGYYGVVCELGRPVRAKIGAFQVKRHYRDRAELAIIGYSCVVLEQLLVDNSHVERVDMNFPGIGYGRLLREHVLPIIAELPDKVHVWEYE